LPAQQGAVQVPEPVSERILLKGTVKAGGENAKVALDRLPPEARAQLQHRLDQRTQARARLTDIQSRTPDDRTAIEKARNQLRVASCSLGEDGAEAAIRQRFPGPPPPSKIYPPPGHDQSIPGDFDQVWEVRRDGRRLTIVAEAKGAGSGLGTKIIAPTVEAEQGTPEYYDLTVRQMQTNQNPDPIRRTEMKRVGDRLAALDSETDVLYLHIKTPVREMRDGRSTANHVVIRQFDLSPRRQDGR
jgi:hypothetical protein